MERVSASRAWGEQEIDSTRDVLSHLAQLRPFRVGRPVVPERRRATVPGVVVAEVVDRLVYAAAHPQLIEGKDQETLRRQVVIYGPR